MWWADGVYSSQQKLADRFGISQTIVSKILRGELWSHVT